MATRPYLNLGIVAHVDAGKTSLTERLLYDAGVVDAPGSVDAGTTRTDSMDLERRRGITIRAAVTSFDIGDLAVNLVDTPGHPDFIAEVERSLTVLDAAVLVLSSVEGVQPQTVVLWRALRRIGVPTALFVNKVDRGGSDVAAVVAQVRRRLTPHVVQLARPVGQGTRDAGVVPVPLHEEPVVEAVAEVDDGVLRRWVDDDPLPPDRIRAALRRGTCDGTLTPLLCGSALTGVGVPLLRDLVHDILPRASGRGGARRRHRVRGRPRRAGPADVAPALVGGGPGARSAPDRGRPSPRPRDGGRRQRAGRGHRPADGDGRPDRRSARPRRTDRRHPGPPTPSPDPPVPARHDPRAGRAGRPDPARRALRRAHRAGGGGPADRPAPRRRRGRGRAQPARRGAEGGRRRAARGAVRGPRAVRAELDVVHRTRRRHGLVDRSHRAARQPLPRRYRVARRRCRQSGTASSSGRASSAATCRRRSSRRPRRASGTACARDSTGGR